jgi:hypothetical protein
MSVGVRLGASLADRRAASSSLEASPRANGETGSNQEGLHELFAKSRAALYEGASIVPFPRLGDDFLTFVSQQAVRIFRQCITESALREAFERFQYQPRALVDLVFFFASGSSSSFADILNARVARMLSAEIAQPQFDALTPLQRQIAGRLAAGGDVVRASLDWIVSQLPAELRARPGSSRLAQARVVFRRERRLV